ncbi:MAG TPA: Gfo/Idh/MocA family oxidoreductase [Bryobacteraceae bacterium]|nr:Gfo/Idh/MocA family oxidoreductase [Bryobacteraceae bacterium]
MRVGMIGTGAISHKHAQAYRNIGYELAVCTDINAEAGKKFADQYGAEFVSTFEEVCRHPEVDYVDVCTFPDFRLQPLEICAQTGKHIQVQKPISTNLETARRMIETARQAGIVLGVVSQHRFDDSSQFLKKAIADGRLGRLIQCDCYVKWYRSPQYYSRPIKGSWAVEGGGALINQAIHQLDILRWMAGPVSELFGYWQLGSLHKIESEDVVNAVVRYRNGATGVIQASTAFWPGYTERTEFHGTKGTAIISGDKLTTWDVEDDSGEPAPVDREVASGASDPMAISLEPFERQFLDFGEAIRAGRPPLISGEEGYHALEIVDAVYRSCRTGEKVAL